MNNIDGFFRKFTDLLVYLELKEEANSNHLLLGLPLPLVKSDFLYGIETGNLQEEIEIDHFIKGMIYNISIDDDFKYSSRYKEALKQLVKDLHGYIFYKGIQAMKESVINAVHFFRANYLMGDDNPENSYYYSAMLLELAKDNNDSYEILFSEGERILNEIIRDREDYPLSYFALGNIEAESNNPLKAIAYYKTALKLYPKFGYDENVLKQLTDRTLTCLENIEMEGELIRANDAIGRMDIDNAIEILERIDNEKIPKAKYLLAVALYHKGEYEDSLENYRLALEKGYKEVDLFIEYGNTLSSLGLAYEAMEIYDRGLEIYEDHEILLFNKVIININLGFEELALEDLNTLLGYGDISDDVFNQGMILKERLESNQTRR